MLNVLKRAYSVFVKVASGLQSPLLLAVRLYWGWQFWQAGYGKLTHIEKASQFFATLDIPWPLYSAYGVGTLEAAGGILLMAGLFARPVAFLLTINMCAAFVLADRDALFSVISDPDKFMGATPFTFLLASLIILSFGPGKFSIDRFIKM